MKPAVFATLVTAGLCLQGWALWRWLGYWATPLSVGLGFVEERLLWRWVMRKAKA